MDEERETNRESRGEIGREREGVEGGGKQGENTTEGKEEKVGKKGTENVTEEKKKKNERKQEVRQSQRIIGVPKTHTELLEV